MSDLDSTTSEVTLDCGDAITLRAPRATDAASIAQHANNRDVWINLRDVNGEAAGAIGLVVGSDIERYSAEVGYWLGTAYWGRGIATSALRRVCRYAFEELALQRVFATPMLWNPASCKALEKAGFEREGGMALYAKIRD